MKDGSHDWRGKRYDAQAHEWVDVEPESDAEPAPEPAAVAGRFGKRPQPAAPAATVEE